MILVSTSLDIVYIAFPVLRAYKIGPDGGSKPAFISQDAVEAASSCGVSYTKVKEPDKIKRN